MSYQVPPPVAVPTVPAAPASRRRPVSVTLAAVLLGLMALAGLAYAITTIAIAPGVVTRFRDAAQGAASAEVDGFASVVWIGAAVGAVVAVILFALCVVLALGLRRGSNAARIGTWVVSGLGLLAGFGSLIMVLVQRSGEGDPGSLGAALSGAYPDGWIGLNVTAAVAQMVGYLIVAGLLLAAPASFFGRGPEATGGATAGTAAPGSPYGHGVLIGHGAPYGTGAGAYGTGYPPVASITPTPGQDDEFWSRPSA
ncbi:hypothetical protein EV385_2685 [Krasilnikovia cinnamomea]|uniref:Uncharacterized protein n=1 Tax=Krasilnikovia cinnamomea TaxID=349313 RepID=A0A4Q7ZKN2_9ACTN|nr:hypothetical protein [Krasilnikovia cinnamomea]RZU50893.1 hypothetical protein EV385_2685 [Krasilnikovia cinnamomea]